MDLVARAYDSADAQQLIAEVQQEYVTRYGEPDATPTDPVEFQPPLGEFLVGYLNETPVACAGWRAHDGDEPDFLDGDAELKRMYVAPAARGRGLSRQLLAAVERSAAAAGRRRMVLETGTMQPEAIALYLSSGYLPIPGFGLYREEPGSRYFARDLGQPQATSSTARKGSLITVAGVNPV
ncbi:acetyltransferase (GNAT) family protein [Nocardia tenerifensis]|uniref:Acetyltransferase (GNAT) family protein n=1 Tax=Nocardia tenerifensis TaxID=228006 RepID=A0A318JZR0_9NOCA|nr:GNAT family N-acetyltransferase [Nocardia tenerifensis]PXX60236.1 acetyltransferase (GNAT) family protein [Nocardia tenerifensis]